MKYSLQTLLLFSLIAWGAASDCPAQDGSMMSDKYNAFWDAQVQATIDANIEKHRKADVVVTIGGAKPGTEVKVEQITHAFRFGGNFFMFGQLDSAEKNKAYADAFGDLWNSGTVPFYWKTLEFEPGKPRFEMSDEDTPEFWASVANPKEERHWRRPPTDPCVDYLESRGLHVHGHAIIYGMRRWGHPEWMPSDRKAMEPLFSGGQRGQEVKGVRPLLAGSCRRRSANIFKTTAQLLHRRQ